ncbi:MAG: hypothetical protein LUF27_04070 [Lachnospiraceae bacterium]|nr:hypothetical protein [Lachnospiraceae bacterium]
MGYSGRNAEGYSDPTFFAVWGNIRRQEREEREAAKQKKKKQRTGNPHGTRVYRAKKVVTVVTEEEILQEQEEAEYVDSR